MDEMNALKVDDPHLVLRNGQHQHGVDSRGSTFRRGLHRDGLRGRHREGSQEGSAEHGQAIRRRLVALSSRLLKKSTLD